MSETQKKTTHCHDLINKVDHDRYLTVLYAPEEFRDSLFALYAFNYEIAIIRENVSEPMLGEIRLQWWREAIDDIYQGRVSNHEVVAALAASINAHNLPREILLDMIEGRRQDLYDDIPTDFEKLEGYLSQTSGNLSCLAVHILGQKDIDDLAKRLGIAWGYVGIARCLTYHLSLRKSYIPRELLIKYDINEEKFLSPDQPDIVGKIIAELCQKADGHLNYIRKDNKRIGIEVRSVFLLTALTRSYLKSLKKVGYNPFKLEEKADAFFRQWRMLTAALFNRI